MIQMHYIDGMCCPFIHCDIADGARSKTTARPSPCSRFQPATSVAHRAPHPQGLRLRLARPAARTTLAATLEHLLALLYNTGLPIPPVQNPGAPDMPVQMGDRKESMLSHYPGTDEPEDPPAADAAQAAQWLRAMRTAMDTKPKEEQDDRPLETQRRVYPGAGRRSQFTYHSCLWFPLLSVSEYEVLQNSVQVDGLLEPIVLLDNLILDGRHRLKACLDGDTLPRFRNFAEVAAGLAPIAWILAKNLHRRHLTDDQALAIVTTANGERLRVEAAARQTEGGKQGGKKVRQDSGEGFTQRDHAKEHANSTAGQLAEQAKVSRHKAEQAVAVSKAAPDLLEQVANGELKLKAPTPKVTAVKAASNASLNGILRRAVIGCARPSIESSPGPAKRSWAVSCTYCGRSSFKSEGATSGLITPPTPYS